MQVYVRFNAVPAAQPHQAKIARLLALIPAPWLDALAQVYKTGFLYGVAFYLAGWLVAALWLVPPGAMFSRNALWIAAIAWVPFVNLYAGANAWFMHRLAGTIRHQQHAIENLEAEFGDVISESVTMVATQLQTLGRLPFAAENDDDEPTHELIARFMRDARALDHRLPELIQSLECKGICPDSLRNLRRETQSILRTGAH